MDVEILDKTPHDISSPIQQKAFRLLFDEKPVRVYRLMLEEGKNIQLQRQTPFLIIGLTDAAKNVSVNKKSFSKKGDFLFIPRGDSIKITNKNQQPYSFAILEFK